MNSHSRSEASTRSFELLVANKQVLELMATNRSLEDILSSIVNLIETFASGCISSAYFVTDGKLRLGAAPSFPKSFMEAVDGCPIGHNQGTCGHAAFTGKRAISTDVTVDEVWGPFRDWILSYGIKAAWSTPVLSDKGEVLATVSMCWKEKRVPTDWDFEVVDVATSLMSIAVERKRQEKLILEQQMKLVNSSKLAALGEMVANLAHEINNPLAIIQTQSDLLRTLAARDLVDPQTVAQGTAEIEKTVQRISSIIKGLRSLSRDGEREPYTLISVNRLVEETLGLCRERFKKIGIPLTFIPGTEDILVDGIFVQLTQTLLNLLNNAFDAVSELPERWVRVEAHREGQACALRVTDSGAGIPQELRDRIMQPFYSTKPSCLGSGLGFSISKKIVEAHHGTLSLAEASNHTCFEIRLPETASHEHRN